MNSSDMAPSDGPFIASSVNNHTNFTPVKTPAKTPKPPKAPEKPLMPYMRYSREIWESVKAANQDQKLSEIGRIIGRMWRELPPHEKQKFVEEYELDKVRYLEALKIYQTSPAYQQYLVAKEKFTVEEKEVKAKVVPKAEPRIALPACDNDEIAADELDYFHQRQLAAARFHRNQRLLQEVFNDACVPDLRQVITAPRLMSLKRQVETLTMHQKKIDTEVNQLVETFETKKRRLEDGSSDFQLTLEKYSKPAVTSSSYETLVEQAEKQLLEKYKAYLKNIQQPQNGASTPTITPAATSPAETAGQQPALSPAKTTTALAENGTADVVVKTEPTELRNGESESTNGPNTESDTGGVKAVVNGDSPNAAENGVVTNGVDHETGNE